MTSPPCDGKIYYMRRSINAALHFRQATIVSRQGPEIDQAESIQRKVFEVNKNCLKLAKTNSSQQKLFEVGKN